MSRVRPLAAAALVVAAVSCHDSIKLPPVQGPPLQIPEGRPATASNQPLEIRYVSPEGELREQHTQITVTFNKPMVALDRVEQRAAKAPLVIEPPIAAKQRWLGSRTLVLQPDAPLAGSTRYRLRVPAGVKALDGSALAADKHWSFETPRVRVSRMSPYAGTQRARPDQVVALYFNQPVSPKNVEGHVSFLAHPRGPQAQAMTIAAQVRRLRHARTGQTDPKAVLVTPVNALPLDSQITVQLTDGLRGDEGPLPLDKAFKGSFSTYGPFRVTGLGCSDTCDPESSVALRFTNGVSSREARAAIRVNGRPLSVVKSSYPSRSTYLNLPFRPRRRYTVTVDGPLHDRFGQPLTGPRRFTFRTRDYDPFAQLPIGSGVIEASSNKQLGLSFRNALRATLSSKRLSIAELAALMDRADFSRNYDAQPVLLTQPGFSHQELKAKGPLNQRVVANVDLAALVGGGGAAAGRGLLAVELVAKLRSGNDVVRRAVLRMTDLAVTAKYSPHDSLVWVTSLAGGKPVAGAAVEIWRPGAKRPLWRGKTDRHGLAAAPGTIGLGLKQRERTMIFHVRRGDDESFVTSSDTGGLSPWIFGYDATWDEGGAALLGMIFSDRGIYRPGEKVRLKGMLRRRGAQGLEQLQGSVKVSVTDGRGEELHKTTRELTDFGSFDLDVTLPPSAPLGSYSVRAEPIGPDGKGLGGNIHGRFRVEEFRPAEFAVSVKPAQRAYVRGDRMRFKGDGRYLFGAPMRGAKQSWTIYRRPTSFNPPGHEGFVFADEAAWWRQQSSQSGSVARGGKTLDEQGEVAGELLLKPPGMRGPQTYELELTVSDISRQTVAARANVLLHPGEFYVGAKPTETFVRAGEKIRTEVIAARPDGKRVGAVPVQGSLYRRTWQSVRKRGMGGAHYFVTRPVETKVGDCALTTTGRGKAPRCEIEIAQAGYHVLRLSAKDARNNPLASSLGFYASGPDYVPWRRENDAKVELITDRKRYKVGQTARILIKSPFANAHGLLTVESNGIHLRRPLHLTKTAAWVEVPITAELVPNAYVSLMLVRGRVKAPPTKRGEDDPGKPVFKVGYAKLDISQRDRRLQVRITPAREQYRPGQRATIDLSVRDARGKPVQAELTVIAADEGVLSLIGYKTPDPMTVFYADRGLSVLTADNRNDLINPAVLGQKGGNPGGGGAEMGGAARAPLRSKFVSTPLYEPRVRTDADGKARVSFELPDNLTTFRIMAVAISRGAEFGNGQSKVVVNKPLLLLPTLPRLVRVGDTIEAGVVVHNHAGHTSDVDIGAAADGISLIGATTRQLRIKDGGAAEARFSFKATTPGSATFRFTASAGDFKDGLELTRPVKLPLVIESVATIGSTDSAVAEGVVPSGQIRSDVGGLDVTMASSALVGLKAGFEYLLDYPYECIEQSTSRLVPLVLLADLARAYKLQQDDAAIAALVGKLIAKVQKMQRWDGGFGYWSSSYESSPWASAYATWGLLQAKRGGHAVSQSVLSRARNYLERRLRQRMSSGASELDVSLSLNTRAYMAFVLAELEAKVAGDLAKLYEQRDKLATFGKAMLLSAMAVGKGDAEASSKLLAELVNQVHQTGRVAKVEENLGDGYAPLFHSDVRSTAMVLDGLLRVQPEHHLVDKLVRYLISRKKNGRWRNTQETVYALLGLHRYYQVREQQPPDFIAQIVLGGEQLAQRSFRGRSLTAQQISVPMKQLIGKSGVLGFVKQGRGTLHYAAQLRYARAQLPTKGWDEGFYVTRRYERIGQDTGSPADLRGDAEGGESITSVKAGEMVRVTLKIVVPQQAHFVAVEDPLPAGLEALNFSLMTATRSHAQLQSYRSRSRYARGSRSSSWYTPFYHREIRDDRIELFADSIPPGEYTYVYLARATTIGKFVVPPTHVEQMYEPEVFGRTGAITFDVTAP